MPPFKRVALISNGDFRDTACVNCWPMQSDTLKQVQGALTKLGVKSDVYPKFNKKRGHGFVTRQAQGAKILSEIDPETPVIVVLSCWAYAHHVCGPLQSHRGPILLLGNFDGTWPGLVALLNHAGTLERLGVPHSRLWTDAFQQDAYFMKKLGEFVQSGKVKHSTKHLTDAAKVSWPAKALKFGETLAADIKKERRILGQLDPGCMGMINAVMDPAKLGKVGMPIEYLNQSDLLAEMDLVPDDEAQNHLNWLIKKGATFEWGTDGRTELVHGQVLSQMKMYVAACQFFARYGLSAIGIPYQLGLVRCCPASDLVEGMLNNVERPSVRSNDSLNVVAKDDCIPHFNEGDLGSAIPQVLMHDIYRRKNMPPETTLHDVRWGRDYEGRFIWVLLISGAAPPAHFGGWKQTTVHRQPDMYFPMGGGTCSGVSKPGTITWARAWETPGELGLDCGVGEVVDLPQAEVQERLDATTPVWPIANAYLPGYGRDECMATHMSNHITIGYGDILPELAATALSLGFKVRIGGDHAAQPSVAAPKKKRSTKPKAKPIKAA
jgi:L-fucose isomerase-like protein